MTHHKFLHLIEGFNGAHLVIAALFVLALAAFVVKVLPDNKNKRTLS